MDVPIFSRFGLLNKNNSGMIISFGRYGEILKTANFLYRYFNADIHYAIW